MYLFIFTLIFLIVAFFVWKLAVIVPMRENWVLERLGNFKEVLQPGFHIIIPFIDRIAYRHEIREQVLDVPAQHCITRDNIQVAVDGLVYLKVMDAKKASYGVGDYRRASVNLAQTTMRSEIGKRELGDTFAERDELNDAIVKEIDNASDPWGVKVMSYEIKNISPSPDVVHTLEKQMEAERERRAEVVKAEASREAQVLRSEGKRQEAINMSEGDKQKRINEAEGQAQEIALVADASAKALRKVAAAAQTPGGDRAVRMKLVERFIDNMSEVIDKSQVSVYPADLARLKGVVGTLFSDGNDGNARAGEPTPSAQRS